MNRFIKPWHLAVIAIILIPILFWLAATLFALNQRRTALAEYQDVFPETLDLQELYRPPVIESDNAASYYEDAFDLLCIASPKGYRDSDLRPIVRRVTDIGYDPSIDPEQAATDLLADPDWQKAMHLLEQGTACAVYRMPREYNNFETLLPEISIWRNVFQALGQLVERHHQNGEHQQGAMLNLRMAQMAQHIFQQSDYLITYLVACSLHQIALDHTIPHLNAIAPTTRQEIIKALYQIDYLNCFAFSIHGEVAAYSTITFSKARDYINMISAGSSDRLRQAIYITPAGLPFHYNSNASMTSFCTDIQRFIANAKPNGDLSTSPPSGQVTEWLPLWGDAKVPYESMAKKTNDMLYKQAFLQTVAALYDYQQQHGKWPSPAMTAADGSHSAILKHPDLTWDQDAEGNARLFISLSRGSLTWQPPAANSGAGSPAIPEP